MAEGQEHNEHFWNPIFWLLNLFLKIMKWYNKIEENYFYKD